MRPLLPGAAVLVAGSSLVLLPYCAHNYLLLVVACSLFGVQGVLLAFAAPTLMEMFPNHKFHRVIGIAFMFSGLTLLAVPQIAGRMAESSIRNTFTYWGVLAMGAALGHFGLAWLVRRRASNSATGTGGQQQDCDEL